jgi:hypothetical protein
MVKDHNKQKVHNSPRLNLQYGILARESMTTSSTVGRYRYFHPQSRVSSHDFKQGRGAGRLALVDIA